MSVGLSLSVLTAGAQTFQEGFFLDGYRLGYRYNPAIQNENAFLSVGQFESLSKSNVGAASFYYPTTDGVVTWLHSSIPAGQFLRTLPEESRTSGQINYSLFSHGWRRDKNYHTIEAGLRVVYGNSVPKEAYELLKIGSTKSPYDLSGLEVEGNAVVELAYGYSRRISDILSLGFRAKLLVGVEALQMQASQLTVTMNEEVLSAEIQADMDLTSRWSKIRSDEYGNLNFGDISKKDKWKYPPGAGLAVDLGILLTPVEGLTLSASVTDLGGLLWYYGNAGQATTTISFEGFEDLSVDELKNNGIVKQLVQMGTDYLGNVKMASVEKRVLFKQIPVNLNLGAKYALPFYRPLSIGATGYWNGFGTYGYAEGRVALAWNPFDWLGLTANVGGGTYGGVYGYALHACFKKFRLTFGMNNGFGGHMPYTNKALKPCKKQISVGLTYDL